MTTIEAPKGAARRNTVGRAAALVLAALLAPQVARAQDRGTLNPQPLPPLAKPDDPATPAKELFGRKSAPANLQTRTIGFYSKGCLAGAVALPINGTTWQVMRLSRNRNWGHPNLVQFLERLAAQAPKTGWHGLLVGDMSQPRGGPMLTGHASHQVGLDADIWLTPMPNRELTREEREEISATMIVAEDRLDGDPQVWTPQPPRPADDGCGQALAYWFTDAVLHPRPSPAAKPKPGPKMADLPAACRQVLLAP